MSYDILILIIFIYFVIVVKVLKWSRDWKLDVFVFFSDFEVNEEGGWGKKFLEGEYLLLWGKVVFRWFVLCLVFVYESYYVGYIYFICVLLFLLRKSKKYNWLILIVWIFILCVIYRYILFIDFMYVVCLCNIWNNCCIY